VAFEYSKFTGLQEALPYGQIQFFNRYKNIISYAEYLQSDWEDVLGQLVTEEHTIFFRVLEFGLDYSKTDKNGILFYVMVWPNYHIGSITRSICKRENNIKEF
jgi:hypothetical protein